MLNEGEAEYAGRAEDLVAVLPELVLARFGDPLPPWSNVRSGMGTRDTEVDEVEAASSRAGSNLLAMVGMTALVPGSIKPELDQIDVPTLVALGENDIAGWLGELPRQLPACRDLTLFTLSGAGHNHNVANSRNVLWNRLLRWMRSVVPECCLHNEPSSRGDTVTPKGRKDGRHSRQPSGRVPPREFPRNFSSPHSVNSARWLPGGGNLWTT